MISKIFDLKNFNFHTISNENFREKNRDFSISKIFVGRFQNSLIMVLINRFGQNFVQNYVEFNGGGRGIKSKANGVRGRPLNNFWSPLKFLDPSRVASQSACVRIRRAHHMVSSGYSDSQNVDLWTNLTKSRIFSTRPDFFLLEHIGRLLTIRKVLRHDDKSLGGHRSHLRVPLDLPEAAASITS